MKALILNGAVALRDMAAAAEAALTSRLAACGYEVARRYLTALDVPDCNGDFGCWTVTRGVCVQPGPHRDVAREMIRSDLVVWLTPVTFGGHSSALKRQLDHCIPLISPWFTKVDGETHHEPRYERFPGVLAVGLLERPETAAAEVFERVVRRNVINLHAPRFASPCLTRGICHGSTPSQAGGSTISRRPPGHEPRRSRSISRRGPACRSRRRDAHSSL